MMVLSILEHSQELELSILRRQSGLGPQSSETLTLKP